MKRQHYPRLSSSVRLPSSPLSRSRRRTVPASAARGRRDGNPISRPSWKRWMDLRLVAVRSRPRRAAPVELCHVGSCRGRGLHLVPLQRVPALGRVAVGSEAACAGQQVQSSHLGEAKDVVLCDFFEAWMILKRA